MGGVDHSVMGNTRVERVDIKSRKIFQQPLLLKHFDVVVDISDSVMNSWFFPLCSEESVLQPTTGS